MMRLIKLELAKNNLKPYLWGIFCIFVFGLGFCFFMGFVPMIESGESKELTDASLQMFTSCDSFSVFITILFSAAFSVWSAVMYTKFTIEKYVGKHAVQLFSYPESRSRILFAKCSLVFFVTVIGMFVTNMAAITVLGSVQTY